MRAILLMCVFGVANLSYADDKDEKDECHVAVKGDSPIVKACQEGGREAAKKKMKELVDAAKKNGQKFKCGHCHEDTKKFKLKDDGREDFKKLLAAANK